MIKDILLEIFYNAIYKSKSHIKDNRRIILFINPSHQVGGAEVISLDIARFIRNKYPSIGLISVGIYRSANDWEYRFREVFDVVIDLSKYKESHKKYILLSLINKSKPKIIINQYNYWGYYILDKINKSEIMVIDILHSADENIIKMSEPYIEFIDKRIVISNKLSGILSKRYHESGKSDFINRIKVIHNGIDDEYFKPKEKFKKSDEFTISFIGRISEEKQPYKLIEIAILVIENGRNINFKIIGDGPLLKSMKQGSEGIEGINFYGSISQEQVIEVLDKTDLLILTSYTEGTPMVVIEAMAMEVPVISTNVGEIDEIIDNGENGILVKNDEEMIGNMVEKIFWCEENREIISQYGKAGRMKILREFSKKNMAQKYLELVRELLG
jgi:glycosyltransferase involved in cell wall biosynthesis